MSNRGGKKVLFSILFLVLLLVFAVIGALAGGLGSLKKSAEYNAPTLEFEDEEEVSTDEASEPGESVSSQPVWEDGWVKYNGGVYRYKEDILTFLIMGTDQKGVNKARSGGFDGGQADFLILAVLDPTTKRIELIPINRNTMVDVDVYDAEGNVVRTELAQIAVQHGVGNGEEESCEYQVKAVSRYMYQLPIHGYMAMKKAGVAPLSKAVGGVDLTVQEDVVTPSFSYKKGQEVHLEGRDAYTFVWDRDQELGGADRRLERQKVFLKALLPKVLSTLKDNPASIADIYGAVAEYTTTDVSVNEMLYIAGQCASYKFDSNSLHNIEGETIDGRVSDEFYPDKNGLKELMIDVFYERVDLENQG